MTKKLFPALFALTLVASGLTLFHGAPTQAMGNRPDGKPGDAKAAKVPDFALKRATDGKAVSSDEFKGKVRLIDFWATWCPPCRREIPDFIALQKQYGAKGLVVIGIAMDKQGAPVVAPFVKENAMTYPVLLADDKISADYGNIMSYPTTFLVDRDGNVVKRYIGFTEKATFEKDLKALL
jgi:cytochrome c biogenesis protein CcmG/thiol:disulfide interchange protein DsbE